MHGLAAWAFCNGITAYSMSPSDVTRKKENTFPFKIQRYFYWCKTGMAQSL